MNIDTLTGRELDAAVAQHVIGLQVEMRANIRTGEMDYVQRAPASQDWVSVPRYSTPHDMAAAIVLEVELKKLGWRRETPVYHSLGDKVFVFLGSNVKVVLRHDDGRVVEATGLVNEAFCRAAVKALGTPGRSTESR